MTVLDPCRQIRNWRICRHYSRDSNHLPPRSTREPTRRPARLRVAAA